MGGGGVVLRGRRRLTRRFLGSTRRLDRRNFGRGGCYFWLRFWSETAKWLSLGMVRRTVADIRKGRCVGVGLIRSFGVDFAHELRRVCFRSRGIFRFDFRITRRCIACGWFV